MALKVTQARSKSPNLILVQDSQQEASTQSTRPLTLADMQYIKRAQNAKEIKQETAKLLKLSDRQINR